MTSTSITSQIQWQGLWPRHHPVLRSKTARKVSVDTIGCYRQPRSRRYIHGVHAIQPPKLQGEIGMRDRFSLLRYSSSFWKMIYVYTTYLHVSTCYSVLSFFFLFSSSSIDSRNLTFTIDPFNRSKAGRYLINNGQSESEAKGGRTGSSTGLYRFQFFLR